MKIACELVTNAIRASNDLDTDGCAAEGALSIVRLCLVVEEREVLVLVWDANPSKPLQQELQPAAVGKADDAFGNSQPADDPPWMAYYDQAQHYGDTGNALFDLAIQGRQVAANQRLAAAVDGHSDAYARSRVFSTAKLAILIMITGDPYEATVVGRRAIADAGQLRSRRVADILRELRSAADPHAARPHIADLRQRITQLVDAS